MTYRGRVKNGVIVLQPGVHLREGMDVRVEPVTESENAAPAPEEIKQLQEGLLSFSGSSRMAHQTWPETTTTICTKRREDT